MKKFDVKSFAAGVIVGTLGISTAFAATGIKSAVASDTVLTLKGASLTPGMWNCMCRQRRRLENWATEFTMTV